MRCHGCAFLSRRGPTRAALPAFMITELERDQLVAIDDALHLMPGPVRRNVASRDTLRGCAAGRERY